MGEEECSCDGREDRAQPASPSGARAHGGSARELAEICTRVPPQELVSLALRPHPEELRLDVVDPEGGGVGPGLARLTWRGHLNDDRREDILGIFSEGCGNWGDCPMALLAYCRDGRCAQVLPPGDQLERSYFDPVALRYRRNTRPFSPG